MVFKNCAKQEPRNKVFSFQWQLRLTLCVLLPGPLLSDFLGNLNSFCTYFNFRELLYNLASPSCANFTCCEGRPEMRLCKVCQWQTLLV